MCCVSRNHFGQLTITTRFPVTQLATLINLNYTAVQIKQIASFFPSVTELYMQGNSFETPYMNVLLSGHLPP